MGRGNGHTHTHYIARAHIALAPSRYNRYHAHVEQVVHVLLPVIDLRQMVSLVLACSIVILEIAYPLELKV